MKRKHTTTDRKAPGIVGGTGIFGEVGGSLGLTWSCFGPTWAHLGSLGLSWAHSDSSGFIRMRLDSLGLIWIHFDSFGLASQLGITELTGIHIWTVFT